MSWGSVKKTGEVPLSGLTKETKDILAGGFCAEHHSWEAFSETSHPAVKEGFRFASDMESACSPILRILPTK